MAKKKPASSPPSFEESLEQLETIVRKLEGGQLPLADSLGQYEQGIRHLGLCYKMLVRVEKKVELLSGLDAQGKPLTEPFDDLEEETEDNGDGSQTSSEEPSLAKKRTVRSRRRTSPPRGKPREDAPPSTRDERGSLF